VEKAAFFLRFLRVCIRRQRRQMFLPQSETCFALQKDSMDSSGIFAFNCADKFIDHFINIRCIRQPMFQFIVIRDKKINVTWVCFFVIRFRELLKTPRSTNSTIEK
jgi:hypothetical protein